MVYPDTFEGFAVYSKDEWKTPKRFEVSSQDKYRKLEALWNHRTNELATVQTKTLWRLRH